MYKTQEPTQTSILRCTATKEKRQKSLYRTKARHSNVSNEDELISLLYKQQMLER